MAEVWFRNPTNYVRELIDCAEGRMIFDYGYLVKRRIDSPKKWADMYYGLSGQRYRVIATGAQGAAEYRSGDREEPYAVYPVFQYGQDEAILEDWMQNNVGDLESAYNDLTVPVTERPVKGQEHRVIVSDFPDLNTGPGKQFLILCKELQSEYPDVVLHIHGSTTFALPIRMGFSSLDWEPRTPAAHGSIFLPTGRKINAKTQSLTPAHDWIRIMGYKPVELQEPRVRCMFNIKSVQWAGLHFEKELRIAPRNKLPVDSSTPDAQYDPEQNQRYNFRQVAVKPGDKFLCNQCSLSMSCKFYREGAVCSVPQSEPKELVKFFGTRDAESIMDGLAKVMEINAERAMQGMREEADFGLDPEVTRILANISKDGERLAKLVDPSLRNPKVQVNVGGSTTNNNLTIGNPRQFIAQAIRELEQQGFKRSEITPAMIEGVLDRAGAQRRDNPSFDSSRVIEGQTVEPMESYGDLVPLPEVLE